jgi:hypothetical protein
MTPTIAFKNVSRTTAIQISLGREHTTIVLVSYATANRRSESAALNVEDVTLCPEGLVVNIRRSKTDQEAAGRKVGVAYGADIATCPVRAPRYLCAGRMVKRGLSDRPRGIPLPR